MPLNLWILMRVFDTLFKIKEELCKQMGNFIYFVLVKKCLKRLLTVYIITHNGENKLLLQIS